MDDSLNELPLEGDGLRKVDGACHALGLRSVVDELESCRVYQLAWGIHESW